MRMFGPNVCNLAVWCAGFRVVGLMLCGRAQGTLHVASGCHSDFETPGGLEKDASDVTNTHQLRIFVDLRGAAKLRVSFCTAGRCAARHGVALQQFKR